MRMHKTKLFTLLFLLCATRIAYADATTDKVTVSNLTLASGGAQGFFTVSLEGTTAYTAYQMDIYLPDGIEIVSDGNNQKMLYMANNDYSIDGNDIYPFTSTTNAFTGVVTTKTYTHTFKYEAQADGAMRILCYSSASEALKTSGALFHVFVKASPYAKPGLNEITLSRFRFSTPANQEYILNDTHAEAFTVAGECSVLLNISASNKFGTCVLPFDSALPSGVEAYSCSTYSDDALLLTPATSMEAYTPYIVYAPEGFSGTLSGTPSEEDYTARVTDGKATDGFLTATLKQTELVDDANEKNYYVLQRKANTNAPMFYRIGSSSYILPAGKCYLELPKTSTSAVTFRISDANGIPLITTDEKNNAPIYNLQGQQVLRMEPGQIYIQNGHKIIHKTNYE